MSIFKPKKIAYTKILSTTEHTKATSSIAKGIVGGALLGVPGIVGGAMSGKKKQKTTFLVVYEDGKKVTMEVDNKGILYQQFIQYLKDE